MSKPDTTPPPADSRKTILCSKTFWVQVLTLASALFPQVQDFMAANPVEFAAALAAINVLVRFLTSGSVNIFGNNTTPPAGGLMGFLGVITAAGFLAIVSPSCSPGESIPVRACVVTGQGRVCYSTAAGISAEVDLDSSK